MTWKHDRADLSFRSGTAFWLTLCGVLFFGTAVFAARSNDETASHLTNLALGAKYQLMPAPAYPYCTDAGDSTQLTDGKTSGNPFWMQQGTVGWNGVGYATVTVDLGMERPISGVSLNSAAGSGSVMWPAAIHILVSDDGSKYRNVGDLVALDRKVNGPLPEGYAVRRFMTTELHTKGRFVCFAIIPQISEVCPGAFVDEVEVFDGPDELLKNDPGGELVGRVEELPIRRAVEYRLGRDREALRQAIERSTVTNAALRTHLLERLDAVYRKSQAQAKQIAAHKPFRAVLPFDGAHAELFQIQADLWKASGLPDLLASAAAAWDPIDPFVRPSSSDATINVDTMRGEYRSAALNLANSTARPMQVRIRFDGLPDSPSPPYVTVSEASWTDTVLGKPVVAALPEANRNEGAWTVSVLPGLVRQVWFTFHVTETPPGEYQGQITLEVAGLKAIQTPVRLRVWPLEFPKETTLALGGWCYTDGLRRSGATPQNGKPLLDHLQSRFVNAPWATGAVMLQCQFTSDPSVVQLDTAQFDGWIAEWPNARQYMVFLNGGPTLGNAKIGTSEFDRRVAAWISAWVRHLASKKIAPERLCLLLRDEPGEGADISNFLAWAKAIRAAEPKVRIWEDPIYLEPEKAPPELFAASDVLCPNRPFWLEHRKAYGPFYEEQKRQGRMLDLYSCSGPARLLDPYSYYRLQAWHCWQIGAGGSYFWAFSDNGGTSSWNEYLAIHFPYTPLFLDGATVVAGKQMEAIRESVEDYEYLVMLRQAVDCAKAARRSDAVVTKAESLLSNGVERVLKTPGAEKLNWCDVKERTLADRIRREILEILVEF